MHRFVIPAAAFLLTICPTLAVADDCDDTLNFFLARSDLVVLGQIVNSPQPVNREVGVNYYSCEVKVSDVAKGDGRLKDQTISATIVRFEGPNDDRNPLIKKNGECILFLKNGAANGPPSLRTVDAWFGVQNASPWMMRSMQHLAGKEGPPPKNHSEDDTIKFFLKKTDAIVRAHLTSQPMGLVDAIGVVHYYCEVELQTIVQGNGELKIGPASVGIVRFEIEEKDRHPLVHKDGDCLLFLKSQPKGNVPHWLTADHWFGVQYPNQMLIKSLERELADQAKATPAGR